MPPNKMTTVERASPTSAPELTEKGRTVRHLVEADLLDERYATTQRGLKNRHVQLIALGGSIGTGEFAQLEGTLGATTDCC